LSASTAAWCARAKSGPPRRTGSSRWKSSPGPTDAPRSHERFKLHEARGLKTRGLFSLRFRLLSPACRVAFTTPAPTGEAATGEKNCEAPGGLVIRVQQARPLKHVRQANRHKKQRRRNRQTERPGGPGPGTPAPPGENNPVSVVSIGGCRERFPL